ncbi:hypothetical protein ACFE04_012525 [Oxalis oulophora]
MDSLAPYKGRSQSWLFSEGVVGIVARLGSQSSETTRFTQWKDNKLERFWMKRTNNYRVTADRFYNAPDFYTFPSSSVCGGVGDPFRSAVLGFLSNHALVTCPPSLFPSLLTWQIAFKVGDNGAGVVLDVVEEDVTRSTYRSVYCDQCRVVGEDHPCECCNTDDDVEEWICSQLENNTHLLHGVVHSNGYGHLLTVNGREGGSQILSGTDIMNFWDRLCTALSVRKVTVMDMSKKYGMEYRLIHTICKGYPWYGNWGYEFNSGSYATKLDEYKRAVGNLSNIPLYSLYKRHGHQTRVHDIISLYQYLSEPKLIITTKDLFSFMLSLINKTHQPLMDNRSKRTNIEPSNSNILCTWTRYDVDNIQQGMINVLSVSGSNWVSRRALKGAMSKAGSPQLLDYCLKHLGGKLVPIGMVVQARCNPKSSDIDFRLGALNLNSGGGDGTNYPSEAKIISDLKYLYDQLLHPDTMNPKLLGQEEIVMNAATKLLDCKQFMKNYKLDCVTTKNLNPLAIRLWCHMELSNQNKDDPIPPSELTVLPIDATVADLKREATNAFQDVYAMYKKIEVLKLLEFGSIEDSITLKLLFGSFGSVRLQGRCPYKNGLIQFRKERGTEEWTVDCICGAIDDDGERMLACDTCEVWQHTRCAGIKSSDDIPTRFVCIRCGSLPRGLITESKEEKNLVEKPNGPITEDKEEASNIAISRSTCREEVAHSGGGETRLRVAFRVG